MMMATIYIPPRKTGGGEAVLYSALFYNTHSLSLSLSTYSPFMVRIFILLLKKKFSPPAPNPPPPGLELIMYYYFLPALGKAKGERGRKEKKKFE